MKLNERHFSSTTDIIHFRDKSYQEINFKVTQIAYYFIDKLKWCQNYTCLV